MATIRDFGRKIGGAAKDRAAARCEETSGEGGTATVTRRRRPARPPVFGIYWVGSEGYQLLRRGDKARRYLKSFATADDARAWWGATIAAPDRGLATFVGLWEAAKARENVTDECLRRPVNRSRTGVDHRAGGNVTPETFLATFKPWGVEFGNWQTDRHACLNRTTDALLDLAQVIRWQPEAVTFHGRLALAFGARGHGKAAAHYEPCRRVINLTKTAGAGCLAHEWFHGFDHALSTGPGGDGGTDGYTGTDGLRHLAAVLAGLPVAARSRRADETRSRPYYSTPCEMAARAFEAWVRRQADNDYLANIVTPDEFVKASDRYPYPTAPEMPAIDAAFRRLFGLA
jgi:hypothetical protein